jgi:hypothetical protein
MAKQIIEKFKVKVGKFVSVLNYGAYGGGEV